MIKISIACDGENIINNFEHGDTTLSENSIVIRELEEMKLRLLSFEYESEYEINNESETG